MKIIITGATGFIGKNLAEYFHSRGHSIIATGRSNRNGKTKIQSENDLLSLGKKGFKTIILRPRAVYGKYDNTIIPRILQLAQNNKLTLINGGKALVDITYIGNLIYAIENCLKAPEEAWNNVYNISNGSPITVKEWFSHVLHIFNYPITSKNVPEQFAKVIAWMMEIISFLPFGDKTPAITRWSVGYMAKSLTMSIEKAKQKLNYHPQFSNDMGFEEFARWYRSNE